MLTSVAESCKMGLRCSSFLLLVLLSLSHSPHQLTAKFEIRLEFSRQLGAKEENRCWWTEKACDVRRVWWESGKCLPHTEEKRCFVAKCWTESSPLPQGEESCTPIYSFLFLVYSFSCLSTSSGSEQQNQTLILPDQRWTKTFFASFLFNKLASPTRRGTPELPGDRYRRELRELETRAGRILCELLG